MFPAARNNVWLTMAQLILIPCVLAVAVMVVLDIRHASQTEKIAEAKIQIKQDQNRDAEHKKAVEALTPPKKYYAYEPPCAAGSGPHGCNDRVYGKRLKDGQVWKVTFWGKEASSDKGHWVPDYTRVEFYNDGDEEIQPEDFCGNMLERFTPGQRVKMILKESDLSEYNGCYTIEVVSITFGGKNYAPTGVEVGADDK